MKKLLPLFLSIFLMSCSAEEAPKDPIVGTWKYLKYIEFPENSDPIEKEIHECYQKETMTFTNDGELHSVHYYLNEIMECKLNETATRTYIWEKLSEGSYRLRFGTREGVIHQYTFPDSNTMWMATGGPYERDGVKYESKQYVYIKI